MHSQLPILPVTLRGFRMLATFMEELGGRGMTVMLGMLLGGFFTFLLSRWKRIRERLSVLSGDARDTVVIALHLVDSVEEPATSTTPARRVPKSLRIRSLGQSELKLVVPNGHLEAVLTKRAFEVTERHTLISMEGAEGSFLLETLTNFVCGCVANGPFDHDLYVMAPCCEPRGLAEHQPLTIILIPMKDLSLFQEWPLCRGVQVEHGSDGARILTLREMALRFKLEQEKIVQLKKEGKRTRFVETMYILDLSLDKRYAAVPMQAVPWGRYENLLKEMDLE